jgi:hypothetical protein
LPNNEHYDENKYKKTDNLI